MAHIIDNGKERKWMEKAVTLVCFKKQKLPLFINAEHITVDTAQAITKPFPIVLYAQKKWSALPDEKKRIVYPLLWRKNIGTMAGYPFSVRELYDVYHRLEIGQTVDNSYALIAIRGGVIRELLSALNASLQGKEKEQVLCRAKKEFGISGAEEQVREKLTELTNITASSLAPPITAGAVVQGVFCDIERTLLTPVGEINGKARNMLAGFSENNTPVTLWTDDDPERMRIALSSRNITAYPVISRRQYAGRKVKIAIDVLDSAVFRERYRIFPEGYMPVISG